MDRSIELKKDNHDTSQQENQIDQLVYRLNDLAQEETGVVGKELE